MLEKVLEMLDLEVNKPFKIVGDTDWYILDEQGNGFYGKRLGDITMHYNDLLHHLIRGTLKVVWQPKHGDRYFYPDFTSETGVSDHVFYNDKLDIRVVNTVGVYKTKEEALERAEELVWVPKEVD